MPLSRLIAMSLPASLLAAVGGAAYCQNFPSRPIRIVTADAGGGVDFTARVIAQGLAARLGQQIVVDNRGGSVIVVAEPVVKAPPDGYTLLLYGSPTWLISFLQEKVPFDVQRDLAPITLTTTTPSVLAVHPSLPVKSVGQLIALAKARPGELNYVVGPAGSTTHLAPELFKFMSGVKMVGIPYKSANQGLNAVIAGDVQIMFPTAASATPFLKSGRLRALAVTSALPSALAPELPTVAASGLPGYEATSTYGMFAPAKTPAAIIGRLNAEIVGVLKSADARNKLFNSGAEVVASTPEQFEAAIRREMTVMGKLIRETGIHAE